MFDFFRSDFLLGTEVARVLYHEYASHQPIVDYHCHIDAKEIFVDRRFTDLSELWLESDHYKWRLMRACGVDEELITRGGLDRDKFMAFAQVLPRAVASPVYHWVHLELQRFFGITAPLGPDTAEDIWEQTAGQLKSDGTLRARGIIRKMNDETIVTTDDPIDELDWHTRLLSDSGFGAKVLPCFRPDRVLGVESTGFTEYIDKLGESAGRKIRDICALKTTLASRIEHFSSCGCVSADHGISRLIYAPCSDKKASEILNKALSGGNISGPEAEIFRYYLLNYLAGEYKRLGWVMLLHLGVMRDVNTRAREWLGPNTGFDAIGERVDIAQLGAFLDALDTAGSLPKTLIFSICPSDNAAINAIAGCFTAEGVAGYVQQGSAWWFNDTLGGISRQLQSFAEYGVLGNFVGMLTDSRSFTSYVRHEYFRRILCDYLGWQVEKGIYPDDLPLLGKIVEDICYNNAKEYFGI